MMPSQTNTEQRHKLFFWPGVHFEDTEQKLNDYYKIALPEKKHLIWNQISY